MSSTLADPSRQPAAVPRPQRLRLSEPEGLLQVHTASFRGSCPSIFGLALRNAGLGSQVLISQFLRGGVQQGPDRPVQMCGRLTWLRPDLDGCLQGSGTTAAERSAVQDLWRHTRHWLLEGDADLVVLDELGLAVTYGLVDEDEVVHSLRDRPGRMEVILTGPSIPERLVAMADQVTELRRDTGSLRPV
jgi:cob(I)alamin adenosyltransferase